MPSTTKTSKITEAQRVELARIIGESSSLLGGTFEMMDGLLVARLFWIDDEGSVARTARYEIDPSGDIVNVYEI